MLDLAAYRWRVHTPQSAIGLRIHADWTRARFRPNLRHFVIPPDDGTDSACQQSGWRA